MDDLEIRRQWLVALNSDRQLSRDVICRLALRLDDWASTRVTSTALAQDLRVTPAALARARECLAAAPHKAADELQSARDLGITVLTTLDSSYPGSLLDLDLPPPVLYCQGSLPHAPAMAVVGSRRASAQGLAIAESFGRDLAASGLVVVSGFARGIDHAAHRGALSAPGGRTIAVLGCGLDIDYPRRRRRIRHEISSCGCLLAEFPLGARPAPLNFPIRNRLIAALSIGVLVVQGTPRSGSLITARLALDLGREVYAVPGSILDDRSAGPNTLIRDGALLIQGPEDLLDSLPLAIRDRLSKHCARPGNGLAEGPPAELLKHLEPGIAATADDLVRRSGLSLSQVQASLLELEITGNVKRLPGALILRRL